MRIIFLAFSSCHFTINGQHYYSRLSEIWAGETTTIKRDNKTTMQKNINKRLQVLEEIFEHQDRTIDALNEVIIEQQNQLNSLEDQIRRLQALLTSLQESPPGGEEAPPPHY